jgi:hypothetical protein
MMKLSKLFLCLTLLLGFNFNALADNSKGDYFWNGKNYGRGAGQAAPLKCDGGSEMNGGLCYNSCRDGYHGVGPVCWLNQASYGRGAGSIPHLVKFKQVCRDGKHMEDGMCYNPCRGGFHGVGPVCHADSSGSYGRGGGHAAKLICDGGKEMDAGLCYKSCRAGFTGKGPVCWGTAPAGYHSCGMGVAINESVCASVTESQVQAVAELIAFGVTMGGSGAAKVAIKDATRIEEGEKAASIMGKFFKSLEGKLKELNDVTKPVTNTLADLKAEYKNFLSPEVKRQIKAANFTFAAGNASLQLFLDSQQNLDEVTMLTLVRDLASLTSLVDPSPVSDVISAYAYPAL